jgi:3-hydroxyphenylacetate 6-hydroxylase
MLTSQFIRNLVAKAIYEDYVLTFGVTSILLPILYIAYNEYLRLSTRVPGIGGPKGLPIIGSLWAIRKNAAEQYRLWAKEHGPVYQVSLGNETMVVVNSAEAAKGIFGINAQSLSSRPEFYTFHKVA